LLLPSRKRKIRRRMRRMELLLPTRSRRWGRGKKRRHPYILAGILLTTSPPFVHQAGHLELVFPSTAACTRACTSGTVDVVPEQCPGHIVEHRPGCDLEVQIIVDAVFGDITSKNGEERTGAGGHPQVRVGRCSCRCGGGGSGGGGGMGMRVRRGLGRWHMCRLHIYLLLHMRLRLAHVGIIADPPQPLRRRRRRRKGGRGAGRKLMVAPPLEVVEEGEVARAAASAGGALPGSEGRVGRRRRRRGRNSAEGRGRPEGRRRRWEWWRRR